MNSDPLYIQEFIRVEFFDSIGPILLPGGIGTVCTLDNREILSVDETDQAETRIFQTQAGFASSGVLNNPASIAFDILTMNDTTFNKARQVLWAIMQGYKAKVTVKAGNRLFDPIAPDQFAHYDYVFDPAVIQVENPEFRRNIRGHGLQIRQPLRLTIFEGQQLAVPTASNTSSGTFSLTSVTVRGVTFTSFNIS